jgi:hypothetical protein
MQAAAWAHWRMAMPALWYSDQTAAYKAKLLAVADQLHPTAWASISSTSSLKSHFNRAVAAIKDVVVEAGYSWRHEIAACKI